MKQFLTSHPKRRGFTLIELLVVIAIIAILAAILFPVFARARENARRASCQSNLKQIGLGIMQYTQDYDEHYPMSWYGKNPSSTRGSFVQTTPGMPGSYFKTCDPGSCNDGGTGHWLTWMDMIYPYVKSVQIFVCPSNKGYKLGTPASPVPDYHLSGAYGNTASSTPDSTDPSHYATSNYGFPVVRTGTPIAAVARAAETVMVVDNTGPMSRYLMNLHPRYWPLYSNNPAFHDSFKPHLEGNNIIYGDGHVKWKSLASMQADSGVNSGTACDLNAIVENRPYCTKLWNPFRP